MDEPATISAKSAAKASGFAKNTVGSLAHRGQIPRGPYGAGDVMSLLLARKLVDRGLRTEAACAIGFAVKPEWVDVVLAHDAGERRWLAVASTPAGDPVPFCWAIHAPADAALTDFVAAGTERGAVFVVDLTAIACIVFAALRSQVPA